ncbi:MAG: hypothetical protein B7Z60_04030 [Ferrovum sp. 37-45-19]|jgi:O-6-methylguanine DNA methyltransferase|uniref:methylated-DNA--[protein]-cysteine S-methyltransferase n=1 Tax=Ferrovum sp. JA12 TaxID=1356299 RepID=UPI00070372E8|nr:methylated-DNA--[protein]-cysteine S-methyltransferase [Ferrovum sp. JA12]OYV79597.1 MAG: hypothetical protein B7Z65_05470 [Ferrovum sp. 21-44-67]OYV94608.1 MAG: hypothetical protein B7Z60_04030 [Ferrovum sp. 37-45-19]OZB34565.1 MAG: hypothetical protein B7X47_00775 [Ferrovum sp. 34-44-207]HQT81521.1 methylated-DNA--[protein]-cysteine S-methyltransferase [Ferrovaceae bacterium]KRH79493.1 bifunctional transcriptional activator/DNA repair enzyme Ada [Ferrovum sp. JA12]
MNENFDYYAIKFSPWGYLGVVSQHSVLLRVDVQPCLQDLFLSLSTSYSVIQYSRHLKPVIEKIIHLIHHPTDTINIDYRLDGTVFQKKVWQAISAIPRGRVKTYQEIANVTGHLRAVRAVGTACGANPLPFIIPCHRVVASGGKLGGFGLGIELKKKLLQQEGVIQFL